LRLSSSRCAKRATATTCSHFTEHDLHFHRLICQWSGSYALLRAWDPLYSQIQRFVVHTHTHYFESIHEIADIHLPLIAALRSGDLERSQHEIDAHIMLIWSLIAARHPVETPAPDSHFN
jgi:DNA-binding GntR family transcriptional regulator